MWSVHREVHSFFADIRYGFRLFRRNPGFSLLGVLIIGLGIGATGAIFSLIYGTLLSPLPFADPDHLAVIWADFTRSGGTSHLFSSPASYFDWRDRSTSFTATAAFANNSRTFTALDQPITPLTHEVTANYFDVLGVRPWRGRTFLPGEDTPGHDRVALISYSLWQSLFAGQDSAIGNDIELDGKSVKLVGVLPPGFRTTNNAIRLLPDLWVPRSFDAMRMERAQRMMVMFGRLKPGVTPQQAAAELTGISNQVARENPASTIVASANVALVSDDMTADIRGTFFLLLGAVGMMLLIACANVANLLLARSAGRGRELAMRAALGASRTRMVRQMLVESMVLAAGGGITGIAIAAFSITPLLRLVPASVGLPFLDRVGINVPVVGLALALSVLTALVFGLAPARQALRASVIEVLKDGGRSRSTGRSGAAWRNLLMAAEVALSVVLLAGAGLMIQTFWRLARLDSGFQADHVLTLRNSLRGEAYASAAARRAHFQRAQAALSKLPGVESVTAISFPLPLDTMAPLHFVRPNQVVEPGRESAAIPRVVLPQFFETLRAPILRGRGITEADTDITPRVAVISDTLARRYFAGTDPVGQTIQIREQPAGSWRVVGVAADLRGTGPGAQPEAIPTIYLPAAQAPVQTMTFMLRTRPAPETLATQAERTLWSLGTLMNVYSVRTLEDAVAESYWQSRFTMVLLSVFAGLALALAMAGLYAVISCLTAQRTQEIGIRMALGARPADVLWMITGQGLGLAAAGLVCGVAGSLALGRILASRLFGVTASDPATLTAVTLLLLLVAAAACAIPAFRAARIDPATALRSE